MKRATAIILVLGFQLAGCDKGPAEPPTPKAEEQQAKEPSATLFDSQIKTLKKAEVVGDQLEKAEAARAQQADQASQ